jgi:hypothetical protein
MLKWLRGLVDDFRKLRRQRSHAVTGHAWLYSPAGRPTARECNVCHVIELARYDAEGNTVFGWPVDHIRPRKEREA